MECFSLSLSLSLLSLMLYSLLIQLEGPNVKSRVRLEHCTHVSSNRVHCERFVNKLLVYSKDHARQCETK